LVLLLSGELKETVTYALLIGLLVLAPGKNDEARPT